MRASPIVGHIVIWCSRKTDFPLSHEPGFPYAANSVLARERNQIERAFFSTIFSSSTSPSPRFARPPLLLLHDAFLIEPGCIRFLSWCSLFSAKRMGRQSTRVPAPSPSPREPQQVTTAEQGAVVPHFKAPSSSAQAPPTDKQAWNATAAASEFFSPTLNWGVDPRPPGGFVSYLGNPSSYPLPQQPPNQQAMLQHLHYSGGPSHYVPCPAPQPSLSLRKPRTPVAPSGSQQTINVDSVEDGDKRTEKRLAWTSQEDVRLMSAWLRCSTDPINSNNKKSDQYWGDVTNVYNSTTPKNRRRQVKQAKDHWHTLNKLVFQFHCCWTKASAIYASGQSDAQLLEKAHAFYESDYTTQFHHMDCWRAVNEHTKWTTYNEWLEQSKKSKTPETGEMGKQTSTPEDAEDIPRPAGIKNSKKERNGKGKSKEVADDMELLEKLVATQEEAKKTRRDMIEMQQRSSSEKLEATRLSAEKARLSALVPKDNIEAKKQERRLK